MKYKKSLIFACILICLFMIGSVVASDVNETVVASDNQRFDEEISIDDEGEEIQELDKYVLGVSNEDKLNYGLDDGSFKDLKNDITNAVDELNLTRDYVFDSSVDTAGAIIIDKPIVINGNGHDILAESKTSVFSITSANVVLKNINFYDCSGRAVDWQANNGTLLNCKFEGCKNTDNGGVVYWGNTRGLISDCVFKSCTSSYGLLYSCYCFNSGLKVANCEFLNSKSSAIYLTTGRISVNNCTFKSISGNVAIYGRTSFGSCINNSKFIENSNRAIYWEGDNLEIDNSIFLNNSYKVSSYFGPYSPINSQGTLGASGGAIYIYGNYTRISNSVFKGNKISASIESHVDKYKDTTFNQWNYYNIRETFHINSYGGAVYLNGNKFYLNNISCEDNLAYSSGKVFIEYAGITYDMVGINMYQNVYANSYGGAIYLNGGGILSNSYISENKLDGYANVNLGKIGSDVCPTKCVVKGYGAGVYWTGSSRNNLVNNTVFVQNNLISGQTDSALYLNKFNGDVNSNIFLENSNKVIDSSESEFSADYNWWGNTVTNFNQRIASDDLGITKWLFLNMSSNKSNLEIGDKAVVTLDLSNVYDSSSNAIGHYYGISNIAFDLECNKVHTNVSNMIVKDGVANFEILAQNYGQGSLIAKYNGISSKLTFDISKRTSQVKSQINNCSFYKDELIAYLNVTPNATGTLKVYLNNKLHSSISLNGDNVFSIDLTGLNVNNYTLEAVYNGDNIYSGSSDTITFEIKKAFNTLQIANPYAADYGEVITLNVDKGNVDDGNLFIQIKNSENSLIYEHTYNIGDISYIELPVLDADDYNLFITYESDNYYGSNFDSSFTVNKLDPTVNKEIINTIYGKTEMLFTSSVDGVLIINVLNNTYKTFNIKSNIDNSLNLSDLDAGDNEIEFVFVPNNQNYNEVTSKTTLTIFKSEPTFDIVINDINYKESANLNVNYLNDITGFVNISISNEEGFEIKYSNVDLSGTNITRVLNNLNASKYTINLEYGGNNNYYSTTISKTFNVFKIGPVIMVDVTNAQYGQTAKVIVNSNAEGNITINIGSVKTYEELLINDRRVSQNIVDIDAGTYDVIVTFNGNNNYDTKTVTTQLTISKVNTNVVASVDDVIYSETTVINVRSSVDGQITVRVNSTFIKTVDVMANTVTPVTFENVPVGKHDVSVVLTPSNENYNESSFDTDFSVSKKQTSVSLDVEDSVYGENVIVSVTASEDGHVVLTVGDITRERNVLANTVAKFNLGILAADSYDVSVSFDAGSNYMTSNQEDNIVVLPATAKIISIQSQDNVYGESTVITVKTNVAGVLTVKISDNYIKTFNIAANKLTTFDLGKYDVDDYNIDLSLDAGSNYSKATGTTQFSVTPKQTTVKIDVNNDNIYGNNVIVNVTASESGEVTLHLDNIEKSINVEANKTCSVDFGILDVKSYSVDVTFNCGNNYEESHDAGSLTVYPAQSKITDIQVSDKIYGENVVVNVKTDVNGFLTVKIGDEQKNMEVIANTVASFDFGILDADVYEVNVDFDAGNNYISSSKVESIKILPKPTEVILTVREYDLGENVIVNVTANENGYVTIKLSDFNKTVYVTANHRASIELGNLSIGSYEVIVNFTAGNNYIDSSDFANIKVSSKINDDEINISIPEIKSGSENNITINLPSDATGNVILTINNENYSFTVENGVAVVKTPKLDSGVYDYSISYSGDSKYSSFSKSGSLNVKQKVDETGMPIISDVTVNEKIPVTLPSDAEGTVTLTINGTDYSFNVVNGVANVVIPDLGSGNYQYTITYSGDSKYSSFVNQGYVNVAPKPATVIANNMTVTYGSGFDFIASFFNDDGSPLANSLVVFTVNGNDHLVKTDSNGIAILNIGLGNGVYNIISRNYVTGENVNNVLTIVGEPSPIKNTVISASGLTTVYNSGSNLIITLKDEQGNLIKSMGIKININGKLYTLITDINGQVKFSTNGLAPMIYTATISFAGNDNYAKSSTTAKVTVTKATPKITAKAKTFKKSVKTKKYTITLKDNKGKVMKKAKVTIMIKGKTYKATTNSKGKATFKITKLTKKGTFKSVISYKGNSYYKKVTKKVKIKVK